MEKMINTNKMRIDSYNAFRGICAIGILFSHMSYLKNAGNPFWKFIYDHFMRYGSKCSSFFFIVSGFLLAYTWKEKPFGSYIKGKLKRIYPLTFIVFILAVACSFILNDTVNGDMPIGSPLWIVSAVLNVLLLKAFVPIEDVFYSFHGPSWYISELFVFYIVGFFIIKGIKQHQKQRNEGAKNTNKYWLIPIAAYCAQLILCIAVDCAAEETVLCRSRLYLTYVNPYFRIFGEGLFGVLLCENMERLQGIIKDLNKNILEITAVIIFFGCFALSNVISSSIWNAWVWFLPIGFLLTAFYRDSGVVSKVLKSGFWQFLGKVSFEIYMTHAFVYEGLPVVAGILSKGLKAWLVYHAGTRFLITLVLCVIAAWIIHTVMDAKERQKMAARMRGKDGSVSTRA